MSPYPKKAFIKYVPSYSFLNFVSIIIFEEPVVSKKPTFSTESTSISFQKHQGQSFALLCQAQAFPIPLIRFVYSPVDFIYALKQ